MRPPSLSRRTTQTRDCHRYHHLFRDMLLAELGAGSPACAAAPLAGAWTMPEAALEYSMAAGDVHGAARRVGQLVVPAYRRGRVTTIQRWFGWLEERGGIEGHPMAAVLASLFSALTGRPVDAKRWADAVDRCQYGDHGPPAGRATLLVRAMDGIFGTHR